MNLIMNYRVFHSCEEMLSLSHRSPLFFSVDYERDLVSAYIVTNDNSSDYDEIVYDYSSEMQKLYLSDNPSYPTKVDFLSDPINICYFYPITQ